MTKWIRWGGLVAFVVIGIIVALLYWMLTGPLIKNSIEKYGTQLNGAVVEVSSVSMTFHPVGLRMKGMQVTDPDQPMQNVLQFDSALAALEIAPLFLGKFIVRELSMTGLRFNTERKKSGAIAKKDEPKDKAAASSVLDNVELPSADDILARESFLTDSAGDAFRQAFEKNKAILDQRLAAIPTDEALKAYESDIKALTSAPLTSVNDFTERKKKLDELKKRFESDQLAIQAARDAIATAKTEVGNHLQQLKDAPGQDLQNLKNKYQLNASGAMNVTTLLFGGEAGQRAATVLHWYNVLKPYLEKDVAQGNTQDEAAKPDIPRGGRFIHFPSNDPWPSALLRQAKMTAHFPGGTMLIDVRDVTSEQTVLGRPAKVLANGSDLKSMDDVSITLTLGQSLKNGKDSLDVAIKNWAMSPMGLGMEGAALQSSRVQLAARAEVTKGLLTAQGTADFTQTRFVTGNNSVVEKELGKVLGGITRFNVKANAQGTLTSPSVKVSSDMDRQLSAAMSRRLTDEQQALEQKLERALQARLTDKLGKYGDEYAALGKLDGSLDSKLSQVKNMASAQLEDFAAQEKRKLAEKLEKEKAEAAEKAKTKARDKLKKLF